MANDDDVEHLFSWLQTADLRYREFAGAREITDSVIVRQQRGANNTAAAQENPQSPPLIQTPAPTPAASSTAPLARPPPAAAPTARPAPSGGLLGGAYRESGENGHGSSPAASGEASASRDGTQRHQRSLDAVFARLAGGRSGVPDPRDRMRHIRGFNPPAGRPR